MLVIDEVQILKALEERKQDIFRENEQFSDSRLNMTEMIANFEKMTKEELNLEAKIRYLPCFPLFHKKKLKQPICNFKTIEEAKKWALEQLKDTTLASVDGSQVFSSKEITYPIALVHAGSFLKIYPKDIEKEKTTFEFNTEPKILLRSDSAQPEDAPLNKSEIGLERLRLEVSHAKELLKKLSTTSKSALFLDDTLIYSFLARAPPNLRKDTISSLIDLLSYARDFDTYMIGYIDSSLAKDFTRMIYAINGIKEKPPTDSYILGNILTDLGDHTPPFLAKRNIMKEYIDQDTQHDFREGICFAYIRVHSGRPIRVEFPYSIIKKGEFNSMMKLILAESLLGDGYPHILIRAHQAAVIRNRERKKFYDIVYQFLKNNNISVQKNLKEKRKHTFS